ncbi:uncharacterized protein K02A2.6-like isoform X1 [Aedes albopictus]|uniref:Reverse transcriptase domain-containing protein n=1 Tax=Aedes albopictus TaxID=7160 RepID=A0ABM1YE24_AEDAL
MATPGMIGSIDQYQRHKSFTHYVERFEVMCKLNKVNAETKQSWFISVSGDEVFEEIKLIFPKKDVCEIPYDEMIKKLKARFDKVEPALMNRYEFYNRIQKPNESAENFVLAVKLLAENCNFREFKDEAIRDRLIIGLRDKDLRKKLLMDDDVNLETVEKTIITSEKAESRAGHIEDFGESSKVLSVKERLGRRNNEYERRKDMDRPRYRSWSRDRSRSNDRNRNFERIRARENDWSRSYRDNRSKHIHNSAVCNYCKRKGHIRKNCYFLQGNTRGKSVNFVDDKQEQVEAVATDKFDRMRANESSDESEISCMMIATVNKANEPCLIDVLVQDCKISMEVDTGSAVAVISAILYKRLFHHLQISKCNRRLVVVNGSSIAVLGQISVEVELNGMRTDRSLIVLNTAKDFTPLLGRDWLKVFYPNWKDGFMQLQTVKNIGIAETSEHALSTIKKKYSKVFDKDLTVPIAGHEAELTFKSSQPIFKKAYQVPYNIKDKFLVHLDTLEKQEIITPIQASEWASPVIAVVKKDGEIRMVIDCKVSLNKILIPNTYPLPLAEDIFASLAGCTVFCSLDLAGAYTQLKLSQRSRKYVVINTIKGLYTYNRLPQGASSSAALFQKIMDQILQGLDGVCCYLDDVLIAGKTFKECLDKLESVLARLSSANIHVNFKKCKFFVSSLQYLGHLITNNGLLPAPDKISTIERAKTPENVTELKAYLGLFNYYNKFVPNVSVKLKCLYNLLRKDVQFE